MATLRAMTSTVRRLAVISLHTSPLAQPGLGDSGGMNVYVRELVTAVATEGVDVEVYVRRATGDEPDRVVVEPGFDVVHIDAGAPGLPKEELPQVLDRFTAAVRPHVERFDPDAIHANYWLSGEVGHRLKHELNRPLLVTFHTLGIVKRLGGDEEPPDRIATERSVIACADAVVANGPPERDQLVELYGADPDLVTVVPPGVDRAFFAPGDQRGARRAVGLDAGPVVLFVGRIQPLKGLDLAVEALARMGTDGARLVVVGGPSGAGGDAYLAEVRATAEALGVAGRIRWVDPQPHHLLASWYRAADVVVVPSRSESFGLVALEAAACGTPVVAAAVGGLTDLIRPGVTGELVPGRDPAGFAARIDALLADPVRCTAMGTRAALAATGLTWETSARKLLGTVGSLLGAALVECR